jgi:hypothetical protein
VEEIFSSDVTGQVRLEIDTFSFPVQGAAKTD